MNFSTVAPLTSHLSLLPSIYFRALIGESLAYPFLNAIGGERAGRYLPQQLPFTGTTQIEIVDNIVGVVRLNLRQRIFDRHYISLIGNYGVTNNKLPGLFSGSNLWGGGIEYAYNSIAGPLSANFSLSNRHKAVIFYLNLGYYF
jgi:NTE family protein